jgi:hypothetical protein
MNSIEVIPQFLLTEVLRWTRMMWALDALPNAIIHLLVDVILNVLGIMARIFHLHETTLRHAVRTPARRCKDAFSSDRTINDVWTFGVLGTMRVPFQIIRTPYSTLDAEFGPCWYRHQGIDTVFDSKMCVQISQSASVKGAGTPLAVDSISCDVVAHVSCRCLCILKVTRTAGRPHASRSLLLQSCGELLLHLIVFVLLRALEQMRLHWNPKDDEPDLTAHGKRLTVSAGHYTTGSSQMHQAKRPHNTAHMRLMWRP